MDLIGRTVTDGPLKRLLPIVSDLFFHLFNGDVGWQFLGNTQEEAARRQQLLEANRAERAKRAERKLNKANGIDRPAQSDDEERDHSSVCSLYNLYAISCFFSLLHRRF